MDYKNLEKELIKIRHKLHENSETGFDLKFTAEFKAEKIRI